MTILENKIHPGNMGQMPIITASASLKPWGFLSAVFIHRFSDKRNGEALASFTLTEFVYVYTDVSIAF